MLSNRGKEAEKSKTEASTTQSCDEEKIISVQSPKNTDQLKVKGQFYWYYKLVLKLRDN